MKWLLLLGLAACVHAQTALELLPVKGRVHMLASPSGNIAVQLGNDPGHDGLVLVNSGSATQVDALKAKLASFTRAPIRYVLFTSADPFHTTGAAPLVAATDSNLGGNLRPNETATIAVYAQDNVLARMSAGDSGVPSSAWPTLTFDRDKRFEFNGEVIEMTHAPAAHSDGDSLVFFRGSNVVVTGDVFTTTGYPVIDMAHGGSIGGELAALNHILDLTVPHIMQEGGTMVIPGRGRICDEADVAEYRDMMTIIRDRVAVLKSRGQPLAEVLAAKPTRDYDRRYSTPEWTGDMLVEAIYKTLDGPVKEAAK